MFSRVCASLNVKNGAFKSLVPASRQMSLQTLLHGSPEAKEAGDIELLQHSRKVARGKYVHAFETHRIKPETADAYLAAAENYYVGLRSDSDLHVKLTGSWQTIVGDLDTFIHILEYENYSGFDRTTHMIQESKHKENYQALLPHVLSRSIQLNQEFAFLPSAPPHSQGGIFELRSYQLQPGKLLEWEQAWKMGIEARRKFVTPVGAWFSQIGRLHQVHHLWQYPDLNTRKELRERAWQVDGWSDTVHKTAQLANSMDAFILTPLPFSPLR